MHFCRAAFCACLLAFALAACGGAPLREDVIAQAAQDGTIAFDVVKIDEAVLTALRDRPQLPLHQRFKKYVPPPELKIAIGDTVSVIIWESSADGLFGDSLTQLSLEPGAVHRLQTGIGETPTTGAVSRLLDSAVVSPDLTALLLGGAPGSGAAGQAASRLAMPAERGTRGPTRQEQLGLTSLPRDTAQRRDLAGGALSPRAEQFLAVAEQTGRPGTRIPDQQVGSDGAISIPYAGRIKVANRTPAQVERRIERLLGPKALDPQALVVVRNSVANTVSVAGEAVDGGRIPLSPGDRLLQVVAAAGGAKAPVHDTFVRLSRRGVTATVALATLVAEPEQNIFAEPGDVLTLLLRPQTYNVFGATGQNAAITFTSEQLSLTEALAKAGGLLDQRADPRAVFLFRYEPVAVVRALGQKVADHAPDGLSPVVYRLDLQEAKSYLLARRFPVQDKDIIFVANAQTVPIYQFFQALSQITGPVQTILITCHYSKRC